MEESKKSKRKTDKEKIEDINNKIEKLKAQQKALAAKESSRARKERTRRLIEHGALAEKYLNCENITTEQFEQKLKYIVSLPNVKDFITKGVD